MYVNYSVCIKKLCENLLCTDSVLGLLVLLSGNNIVKCKYLSISYVICYLGILKNSEHITVLRSGLYYYITIIVFY